LANPSNLYAEKAFSEHPIALWALDDPVDYISLVLESQRELTTWTKTECAVTTENASIESPFPNSFSNKIIPTVDPVNVSIISPVLFNQLNIDQRLSSFSIGLYLLDQDGDLANIEIGYYDGEDEFVKTFSAPSEDQWKYFTATFDGITYGADISVVIRLYFTSGSSGSVVFINGLTVGQWSENFAPSSLGVTSQALPSNIAVSATQCVPTYAYGSDINVAYFLVENNALLATNTSIPMVYGASNSTVLRSNNDVVSSYTEPVSPLQDDLWFNRSNGRYYIYDEEIGWDQTDVTITPSIIFPGKGFMNESANSASMTLEAWMRVNASSGSGKIFGPISSQDGLYIDGPFLVLRVGSKTCSHFMGEWFRPFLLDVSISTTSASIMINGEKVSSVDLSKSDITFASSDNAEGKSQDWLGLYVPQGVHSIEVDCIGIYPYEVTEILAKKRFVSGQGISYPQDVNVAYSGESVFIDYAFAKYSKNYDFPEIASWQRGIAENMEVTNKQISSPNYVMPSLSTSGTKTFEDFNTDVSNENVRVITMTPTLEWVGTNSYLYLDSLNVIKSPVSLIYGTFQQSGDVSINKQILFKLVNKTNNDFIECSITDGVMSYFYKRSGQDDLILDYSDTESTYTPPVDERFGVGFNIDEIVDLYPQLIPFFSNRSNIAVYIMGDYSGSDQSLSTMFGGILWSFCFGSDRNIQDFDNTTGNTGIIDAGQGSLSGFSYEFGISHYSGLADLEVSTKSYWDASVPLSILGKSIITSDNKKVLDLDFIQANIDYPQSRTIDGINLSDDAVKVFITFQRISSGANKLPYEFANATQTSTEIEVIEPGIDWETVKYQITDKSIIYLPELSSPDSFADLAMNIHLETYARSASSNKVLTKFIRLSSMSLSDNSSSAVSSINPIGTKFGKNIHPYTANTTSGFPLDISYKQRNPFKIFRGTGPHLYLTQNSGISVVGEYDSEVDRGLFIKLNENTEPNANMSSIQMSALWNNGHFPITPQKIFEIVSGSGTLRFYVKSVSNANDRGEVYARVYTAGTEYDTDLEFYMNGLSVYRPILTRGEWSMLGVVFKPYLIFNNTFGYLKITSQILLDNISTYQLTGSSQLQQIVYRTWEDIENNGDGLWSDWYNPPTVESTWSDMLYQIASFNPSIDPAEIYKVYIGTNKIISDSSGESGVLMYNNYEYGMYSNVQRDTFTATQL